MIELFRKVLPYLLLLFFIVKANKESLYLLGIPFLMFMSNSIFSNDAKIFIIPNSLSYALIFFWLTLLWILARLVTVNKKNLYNGKNHVLNILDICVIGLILITITDFMSVFIHLAVPDIVKEFINLLSLFAGYFIIKDWISRNKPELVIKFFYSLIVINSIASFLFILHQGLGMHIYPERESLEVYFEGEEITRSFWFMPQFLFFSIIFLFVFRKNYSKTYLPLLLLNLLAVFITYTRSYVTIIVVIFLLYFLFVGIKKKKAGLFFKNILKYGLLGIFGVFILAKIFPTKSKFFMERFSELSTPSTSNDPNNLQFRFQHTGNIISNMDPFSKLLGEGPVTPKQSGLVPDMELATSDMVWAGVIFRWGFVGLSLLILLYIFSIINAYKFYMRSEGLLADLALILLVYIISQVLESFVSWTFLSEHGFPTGLWYFATLSWLIGFKTHKEKSFQNINQSWNFGINISKK